MQPDDGPQQDQPERPAAHWLSPLATFRRIYAQRRPERAPDRSFTFPAFRFDDDDWEALRVPDGLALVCRRAASGQVVVTYPEPSGQLAPERPLDSWGWLVAATPGLDQLLPEAQMLLFRRVEEEGTVSHDCHLVALEVFEELTATLERRWRGLGGGPEGQAAVAAFFDSLQRPARPAPHVPPSQRRRRP